MKYTPFVSGTLDANFSISFALSIIFNPSRSHCIAEPVTGTSPSTAYVHFPSKFHAIIVSTPPGNVWNFEPTLIFKTLPVPLVHFTVPASIHASANNADCWSAITPRIGIEPPKIVVSP